MNIPIKSDFDWIFFDCFNTLIDDFDPTGDESGLGSLPDIAVTHGLFPERAAFLTCYFEQRAILNRQSQGHETLLLNRLKHTLQQSPVAPNAAKLSAVTSEMLRVWDHEYRPNLRLTPGVEAMLSHWSSRRKLGVISNFFLPDLPADYLREFGLAHHFDFVLDSAAFGFKKPHHAIYYEALRLAGISPDQATRVLMIGDRLELDILTPQKLGFQVLHFNRRQTRPDIEPTPASIPHIHNWAEFR